MNPRVSVVICTYNQEIYVTATVDSVLAQTYPNVEIIVTDDGSVDATPHILQSYSARYPDKIKIAFSDRNTGIPANINRGLALRTGELTAWLDGDDLMLPQKLEKQVTFLQQHPDALGCYHDADVFDSETGQSIGRMSEVYNGTRHLRQGDLKQWFVPRNFSLPSSIMAWSHTTPSDGYDERLKYLSEVLFFVETFRTGKLLAIDEVLVRYRRHTNNITGNPGARNLMYEYEMIVYSILETRYPEMGPILSPLRASASTSAAFKAYREGDGARCRAIVRNLWRSGAWLPAITIWASMSLFSPWTNRITGSGTFTRPNWVKRIAQFILR